MKPPKFLLAHNEAAQPGAAFIVHTQDPSFVGQILTFTNPEELNQFVSNNECVIVNSTTIVHIQEYLSSNDRRRIDWLKRRLKYWLRDYFNRIDED